VPGHAPVERPQEREPAGRRSQGDGGDEGSSPTPAPNAPGLVEQPAAEKQPGEKPVVGTSPAAIPVVRGDIG
jgi:hypothetical protein